MKYYQKFATVPVFTLLDASRIIGNKTSAPKVLNNMVKEGTVHRIRQNLYTCVNFGTGDDYASRFEIASYINQDSFISFHSALEFYGFYNQSYFDIQVCSTKRFAEFVYEGYTYKNYLTFSLAQVNTIQGVKVATIERAIVDSINLIGKVLDAEELVKCLDLIHRVDENKILQMLSIYKKEVLYRKVGYVLSFYKDELSLSDGFFKTCKDKGVFSNKGYFVGNDKDNLEFCFAWGLYAYKDLRKLASKGGVLDV